jgi:hypothetical protein
MPRLRLIVAATVALILLAPRSQAAELTANGTFSHVTETKAAPAAI